MGKHFMQVNIHSERGHPILFVVNPHRRLARYKRPAGPVPIFFTFIGDPFNDRIMHISHPDRDRDIQASSISLGLYKQQGQDLHLWPLRALSCKHPIALKLHGARHQLPCRQLLRAAVNTAAGTDALGRPIYDGRGIVADPRGGHAITAGQTDAKTATLRNLHTFHRFQPLAPRYANDSDEPLMPGFNRSTKTGL